MCKYLRYCNIYQKGGLTIIQQERYNHSPNSKRMIVAIIGKYRKFIYRTHLSILGKETIFALWYPHIDRRVANDVLD